MSASPLTVVPAAFSRLTELNDRKAALFGHIAQSGRLSAVRPASRLEIRPRPEMVSSGIAQLDVMTGGLPRGCLTEICGGASSGKTSVLLSAIAAATRHGETCALIDASDSFDPASGQAAGINFQKLLWVRCGGKAPHAVRQKTYEKYSKEKSLQNDKNSTAHDARRTTCNAVNKSSERRLEQVLKSADLILQSGGFGLIVLDLAGISEKFVRRIPLASWFRFQRAVEHTKSVLLVITETSCAQTCATLSLHIWKQTSLIQRPGKPAHTELLDRMQIEAEVTRLRLERKPAVSVRAGFLTHAVRFG